MKKSKRIDPLDVNASWGTSAWDSAPSWGDDTTAEPDNTAAATAAGKFCLSVCCEEYTSY